MFREEMARISSRHAVGIDAVAWRYWNPEVRFVRHENGRFWC
jgi:hypothetical protein